MNYVDFYILSKNDSFDNDIITDCLNIADVSHDWIGDMDPDFKKINAPHSIMNLYRGTSGNIQSLTAKDLTDMGYNIKNIKHFCMDTTTSALTYDDPNLLNWDYAPGISDVQFARCFYDASVDLYRVSKIFTDKINEFTPSIMEHDDFDEGTAEVMYASAFWVYQVFAQMTMLKERVITTGEIVNMRAWCVAASAIIDLIENHPFFIDARRKKNREEYKELESKRKAEEESNNSGGVVLDKDDPMNNLPDKLIDGDVIRPETTTPVDAADLKGTVSYEEIAENIVPMSELVPNNSEIPCNTIDSIINEGFGSAKDVIKKLKASKKGSKNTDRVRKAKKIK